MFLRLNTRQCTRNSCLSVWRTFKIDTSLLTVKKLPFTENILLLLKYFIKNSSLFLNKPLSYESLKSYIQNFSLQVISLILNLTPCNEAWWIREWAASRTIFSFPRARFRILGSCLNNSGLTRSSIYRYTSCHSRGFLQDKLLNYCQCATLACRLVKRAIFSILFGQSAIIRNTFP